MSSNVPTVRQVTWAAVIPQILVIGSFIFTFYLLNTGNSAFYGALTYLALSFGLKSILTKDHRRGINFVKQQNFADAIPYFEKSVDFFSKNSWIDNYRFLTLLSSSKMSYREMGLCNIAFCYSQIGDGLIAIEFYQQTLKDYPQNGMAKAGLNMLNSLQETSSMEKLK